jgi:hypothetical protein
MSVEEYWVGKDVDYDWLWASYEQGRAFFDKKYPTMEVHLLQLTFKHYPREMPLFNLEAILKTSKGLYHDLKQACFSREEYERSGPLFVYDINRGSELWRFVGELPALLLFSALLWSYTVTKVAKARAEAAKVKTEQYKAETSVLEYKAQYLKIYGELRKQFPNAPIDAISGYLDSPPSSRQAMALQKLYEQNLYDVAVSREPFTGDIDKTELELISFNTIASNQQSNDDAETTAR